MSSYSKKMEFLELMTLLGRWGTLESLDVSKRLDQSAALLPDETCHRIAYGLASGIAETDGQVMESETLLVFELDQAFGLHENESEEIAHSVRV